MPTVELAFGMWGGRGTSIRREFFAAFGSRGAQKPGGYVIFGSATPTRASTDAACARATNASLPALRGLSQPFVYRRAGMNAYFETPAGERLVGELLHPRTISALHLREPNGVIFSCATRTRVTVKLADVRVGNRVVGTELRVAESRNVLALATLRQSGTSSFRVSNGCRAE